MHSFSTAWRDKRTSLWDTKICPPFEKILVLFKESLRDLKCFHSLFEYCRRYRILASENLTTASEDVKENTGAPIVTNSPRHPGNIHRAFVSSMFSFISSSAIFRGRGYAFAGQYILFFLACDDWVVTKKTIWLKRKPRVKSLRHLG